MSRARVGLATVALALVATLPLPASAQMSSVLLTLRSAPVWNAPDRATAVVSVLAANAGTTAYTNLALDVTLRSAVGSRNAFDETFVEGRDAGRVLSTAREVRAGTIPADGSLDLTVSLDLAAAGVDQND